MVTWVGSSLNAKLETNEEYPLLCICSFVVRQTMKHLIAIRELSTEGDIGRSIWKGSAGSQVCDCRLLNCPGHVIRSWFVFLSTDVLAGQV